MLPQTSIQLREYEMALAHTPVLLDELLELLRPARGETAIDCTFGAGGHAEAVAAALGAKGRLIAVDRDPSVAEYFRDVAQAAPCACELYHGNFADVLAERETASVDIVYMDLGVSSMQLDRRERGFSYAYDAPLDMRMDPELEVTAADLVEHAAGARAHRHLPPVRRGAVRPQHRPRHRAGAQEDAAARRPASSSRSSSARSRRRPGSPPATRRAASSRRCASSSTTSSARWPEVSKRPTGCCAPAAASRRSASTRSRTVWSRTSSRVTRQAASARPACRSACAATSRPCACSRASPVTPRAAEAESNPRSKSAKLRVAVRLEELSDGHRRPARSPRARAPRRSRRRAPRRRPTRIARRRRVAGRRSARASCARSSSSSAASPCSPSAASRSASPSCRRACRRMRSCARSAA